MARSKFRLFHLILEICKSRLSHCDHPAHVVTYTFRKIWAGFQGICGDPPGSHILDIEFFPWRLVYTALPGRLLLVGDFCGLLSVMSAYNSHSCETRNF